MALGSLRSGSLTRERWRSFGMESHGNSFSTPERPPPTISTRMPQSSTPLQRQLSSPPSLIVLRSLARNEKRRRKGQRRIRRVRECGWKRFRRGGRSFVVFPLFRFFCSPVGGVFLWSCDFLRFSSLVRFLFSSKVVRFLGQ